MESVNPSSSSNAALISEIHKQSNFQLRAFGLPSIDYPSPNEHTMTTRVIRWFCYLSAVDQRDNTMSARIVLWIMEERGCIIDPVIYVITAIASMILFTALFGAAFVYDTYQHCMYGEQLVQEEIDRRRGEANQQRVRLLSLRQQGEQEVVDIINETYPFADLPTFDLGNRGYSEYLENIESSELTAPVMKGVDERTNRPFFLFKLRNQSGNVLSAPLVLLQRFRLNDDWRFNTPIGAHDPNIFVTTENHNDTLNDEHDTLNYETIPQLKALLQGSNPHYQLATMP